MGSVRGGPRQPNTTAYFVALGCILLLLALLCCYFFYFCITKVRELSGEECPLQQPHAPRASPAPACPAAYPVQTGVRDSATAMAKLCRQLPPGGAIVFPAASAPAADTSAPAADTSALTAGTSAPAADTSALYCSTSAPSAPTAADKPPPVEPSAPHATLITAS